MPYVVLGSIAANAKNPDTLLVALDAAGWQYCQAIVAAAHREACPALHDPSVARASYIPHTLTQGTILDSQILPPARYIRDFSVD